MILVYIVKKLVQDPVHNPMQDRAQKCKMVRNLRRFLCTERGTKKEPAYFTMQVSCIRVAKNFYRGSYTGSFADLRGQIPLEPLKKAVFFNFILGE